MAIKKVNFLYIGPDKAGSTSIFAYLKAHPSCFVPDFKDIYFFDRYFYKGENWYHSFFKGAKAELAVGEISHDYLFSVDAAERIFHYNPDIKLVAVRRDPVDRSFSHYLYLKRSGMCNVDFWKAIELFPEIIDNSRFDLHLDRYTTRFPADNILVLEFGDFANGSLLFRKLDNFLGLAPGVGLDLPNQRKAGRARFFVVAKIVKYFAVFVRDLGFPQIVGAIKHSFVPRLLYKSFKEEERPHLSEDDRKRLRKIFDSL